MAKKCILVLLDGLGDRPYKALGNRTPLQAADTPVLDDIARKGASGLYHAGHLGQALPSENAHFSIFGYDMASFPGRGAIEALGAGIDLCSTDVAILAHFVSMTQDNGTFRLIDNKPVLNEKETRGFFDAVDNMSLNGVRFSFIPTHHFRGILTMKGDVSAFITDTDPFKDGRPLIEPVPLVSYETDVPSVNAARALKAYIFKTHKILENHPLNRHRTDNGQPMINGIVTQRAGKMKEVQRFEDKYGLKGCVLASGIVYHGLAKYLGMDHVAVEDSAACGDDLSKRIQMAAEMMVDYDFIHVHTKAPDEAAHTKNPMTKKTVIEELDKGIGGAITPILSDPNILLVIAADHSTPSAGPLVHSGEPVPVILHGTNVRIDSVARYDEVSAAAGVLGQIRKKELIYLILNYLDRAKLDGIRDCPEDQPFWPGRYTPFSI